MPEFKARLRTPRLASAPASPISGEMYYDTGQNKLFTWNGTAWTSGGAEYYEQAGTPAGGSNGALWYDTDDVVAPFALPSRLDPGAVAVADWNNAIDDGWYSGSSASNAPAAGLLLGTAVRDPANVNNITQEVWDLVKPPLQKRWRRAKDAGGWGAWTLQGAGSADLDYEGDFTTKTYVDGDIIVSNGIAYLCVSTTSAVPTAWPGGPTPIPPAPVVSYGTSLPVSPADGAEAILVDSLTNSAYQWRFRFNAQSTSAYKWEFVGGSPAITTHLPFSTTASISTWVELAVPLTWTVPFAGVYACSISFRCGSQKGQGFGGLYVTGDPVRHCGVSPDATYTSAAQIDEVLTLAKNDVLRMKHWQSVAFSAGWDQRVISVRPVRVSP